MARAQDSMASIVIMENHEPARIFSGKTDIIHLFELTLWNQLLQSTFLSDVWKMFS
jgi:hypothetical protein